MSERCHELDRRWQDGPFEPDATADGPQWSDHLQGCADCRAQWQAHQELEAMMSARTAPRLSPQFTRRVTERAAFERAARVMRLYWLAAAVGVLVLLQRLEWATIPGIAWAIGLVTALTLAAAPALVSRRCRRLSWLDLVAETVGGANRGTG